MSSHRRGDTIAWARTPGGLPVSPTGKVVSMMLALLPPLRMAWIVFHYGENNLSNDYVARVGLVVAMLDGTCSLGTFVRGAWIGASHSLLAVTPIYWFNARFFGWSVLFEIGVGLVLIAVTLALLARAIPGPERWLLLPSLSLLLFSTSRVTVLTFGEPALQYGLSQLGVVIAALALGLAPARPLAAGLAMAFGGVLASWSWGGGVVVWPVLFGAFVLRRERRLAAWVPLACGTIAGLGQYAWFLPRDLSGAKAAPTTWATKGGLFLDVLGRPFADGIGHADPNGWSRALGAAGLIALAGLLVLNRAKLRERSVALVLIAWTLLVAAQISLVRTGVAPWYASPMALFWVGLLVLFFDARPALRTSGLLVVTALALRAQWTWEDKSFYLPSRAPASAACLREWRTAPPECYERLFQWGGHDHGEAAVLAEPLERHRLSVFSDRRTYLLQGDVAVGRVGIDASKAPAFLSLDGKTPGDPNDFHRLDLVLGPDAAATWRVDLPPSLKSARFETRVRASRNDPMLARGARVTVVGQDAEARSLVPAGGREPLSLDLEAFAGKTVTLRLTAEEAEGGWPLVFSAPKIELRLGR